MVCKKYLLHPRLFAGCGNELLVNRRYASMKKNKVFARHVTIQQLDLVQFCLLIGLLCLSAELVIVTCSVWTQLWMLFINNDRKMEITYFLFYYS